MTTATNAATADIGIAETHLSKISLLLNTILADEYVLYTKTKNFHWNVQGPNFHAVHLFFDEQAEKIEEMIDETAERVRNLGHFTAGTLKEFLELTHLLENNHDNGIEGMIQALVNDHETIIKQLRKDIETVDEKYKDAGTADFLTQQMEKHETMAWMLRAHLA